MKENKTIQNYMVFQEMFSDSMGTNLRVAQMENKRPVAHRLMCQVNPLISTSPERLRRVKILLEGIKKAGIPSLYSPMEMITEENQLYLLYDSFKGRNLEKIFDDATQKGISFSFDLAFSIAIAIADIIESGTSIVISGEKSFHGFLTPDNILFHFDGKIFLKNYGIFPYLDKTGSLFSELETRYGNWLTPEFTRKEKVVSQSDIFHLGYIIYKMMTGKYFTLNSGEDFDSKLASVNLKQYIPTNEKDFHNNLINFFKKTLHPDPMKRFLSIKDFKDYIANYFHIEELSSITFNVAYFMNSLYAEVMEKEDKILAEELSFHAIPPLRTEAPVAPAPEPRKEPYTGKRVEVKPQKKNDELISNILNTLDKEKKRKVWPLAVAAAVIVVSAGTYFLVNQNQKAKAIEQQKIRNDLAQKEKEKQQLLQKGREENERLKQDYEAKLKVKDDERIKSEDEINKIKKTAKDKEIADKLKVDQTEAEKQRLEQERLKKEEDDRITRETEQGRIRKEKEQKDKEEQQELRRQQEVQKAKPGQVVPYAQLEIKPVIVTDLLPGPYIQQNAIWLKKTQRFRNQQVRVNFQALVDENGNVTKINFVAPTPPQEFQELIKEISLKWKYKPGEKDGVKVKTFVPRSFIINRT